jgi:2-polyprenyl-3-methyl-5-hydroxy-6-metoxy-1,4-benzoquinol methylase
MDNRMMPYDDWQFVGDFIEKSNWRFAKTYAKTFPHYYTIKRDCDSNEYGQFYRLIRRYGYYYEFFGKKYIQLNVNENYYWTMGWPSNESEVINRKERRIDVKTPFDTISDEETRGDESDRMAIAEMINHHSSDGKVMEVGCGSGLMTELLEVNRENYLGIDPAWTLIEKFRKKTDLPHGIQILKALT